MPWYKGWTKETKAGVVKGKTLLDAIDAVPRLVRVDPDGGPHPLVLGGQAERRLRGREIGADVDDALDPGGPGRVEDLGCGAVLGEVAVVVGPAQAGGVDVATGRGAHRLRP